MLGANLIVANSPYGAVDLVGSVKDQDNTTGSKVISVSLPLPRKELGAQSQQLANTAFIVADPHVLTGLIAKRALGWFSASALVAILQLAA